jgi:hypothetical protein
MANGQMLCLLAPIGTRHARDVRAALAPGEPLRSRLDQALNATGIVHFASVAVLPGPGLPSGRQDDPRLMIELAVDPHLGIDEVARALARHALREIWELVEPAMNQAARGLPPHGGVLAQWLASHTTIAACGFTGTPERTVRQIRDEAALLAAARDRVQAEFRRRPMSSSAELAAAASSLIDGGSTYDFARTPAPYSFWQRAPESIGLVAAMFLSIVPGALLVLVLLGILAFFGLGAIVAGGLVLEFDEVIRCSLAGERRTALLAMGTVALGAGVLWVTICLYSQRVLAATAALTLLTATGLLVIATIAFVPGAVQSLLMLAGWGALAAIGVVLLALLLILAVLLAVAPVVALVPPPLVTVGMLVWSPVVAALYLACAHLGMRLGLTIGADALALAPVQMLRDAPPVGGWLPASDLVGAVLLALFLLGLALLFSGFRLGRGLPRDLFLALDMPRTDRHESKALFTHDSLVANEAELRGQINHMISVTDLRRIGPFGVLPSACMLRLFLWGVSIFCTTLWTRGRLGRAPGIHFGHWRLIDGGRRLLFSSNFEGSLGGYLDAFIGGSSQGVNLIWRWTELKRRDAAIPDQPGQLAHPAVTSPDQWPPTRLGFMRGCRYEQRFKAYARASQVPHLYRFAAYARSNDSINRATRLRDALRVKHQAEQARQRAVVADDQIMRAIES